MSLMTKLTLTLCPHREGVATLLALRDGRPHLDQFGHEPAKETRAIASVDGSWSNRGGRGPGARA